MHQVQKKAPIIRANILATVVNELVQRGIDVGGLLHDHASRFREILDPYQEVPLHQYIAFFEAAAEGANEPALGARMGVRFLPEELGPVGVVFVAAPSLRIAFNRLGSFLFAWQTGTRVELEVDGEVANWTYQIDNAAIFPRRQDAEFSLSATCSFIRVLLGAQWAPIEVHFEHSLPKRDGKKILATLRTIFKAPVLFDQCVNRLVIETHDLDRHVLPAQRVIAPYLEQHLRDLVASSRADGTLASQISNLVTKRISNGSLDISDAAHELGLSRRTLQRRLAREGTSFREVVRMHRAQMAEALLTTGCTSVSTIAHHVGYGDATAFSRAFKSWHKFSPRAFRSVRDTNKNMHSLMP
ncbi:MAG: AraC family transcriptional regulator [Alphaproteobacteria bacterium]|nr:AraC family transcriptional regulator [Alphaproteobacteria bacterium]MDE2075166.1 AraC family transcriptional regulator [Alphaproteobacteria bacterium]